MAEFLMPLRMGRPDDSSRKAMSKEWQERSFRVLQIRRGRWAQDLPDMLGLRLKDEKTRLFSFLKRTWLSTATGVTSIKSSDERAPSFEKRLERQNCETTRNALAYFSIGIVLSLRGQ